MILKRRVALGGVQLDSLHNRIVIRGFDAGVPHESVSAVNRMGGFGSRMTSQHWETLEASVTYAIDVKKNEFALRRSIVDTVNSWAMQGGWLTSNEQPGKRLFVDKCVIPSSGDLRDWTKEFTIGFRAYNVPFWQAATATTVSQTIASGSLALQVNGNVQSVLDITFKNTSGSTINSISISTMYGGFQLTGLSLANNATLNINHGTDGILRITKGSSTSVLDKRIGSDDLIVKPGTVSVSVNAEGEGLLTVSNYGRYV